VTYLVEWCGMSLRDAGLILSASQIGAAVVRIGLGVTADMMRERLTLLGIVGGLIAAGTFATAAIQPDWPRAAIVAAALLFGISAAAWNGVSFAEFVRWAPPGQSSAISGASTAVIFAGAVVGPASFSALIRATGDYRAGFAMIFVAALAGGIWLLLEGWRLRRG
jgi:MFS-type transporter involved in bile tolerance (Atg22 family)